MARDNDSPAAGVCELQAMLREARTLLTNPTADTLDACRIRLEEAVHTLGRLQSSLARRDSSQDRALAAPLAALRTEIAGVRILLDSAAAFYTRWMQLAALMVSGYTANGRPATPETGRRVLMEA